MIILELLIDASFDNCVPLCLQKCSLEWNIYLQKACIFEMLLFIKTQHVLHSIKQCERQNRCELFHRTAS